MHNTEQKKRANWIERGLNKRFKKEIKVKTDQFMLKTRCIRMSLRQGELLDFLACVSERNLLNVHKPAYINRVNGQRF